MCVCAAVSGLPMRVKDKAGGGRGNGPGQQEQQQKEKERNSDPVRESALAREKQLGKCSLFNLLCLCVCVYRIEASQKV